MSAEHIQWPADDLQAWGTAADEFAQGRLAGAAQGHEHHADPAFAPLLDELQHMGFLALCADERFDGMAQGPSALARVLEPVCAIDASAGAAIYASAAAHLALIAAGLPDDTAHRLPKLPGRWLAWPAFHDIHEQAWPDLDAQGHLHGHVDMMLLGAHADGAVLPARDAQHQLRLVLVDLHQTAVVRSAPVRTLGLSACGVSDLHFHHAACERLADDAAALVQSIEPALASAVMAMQCGVMRGSLQMAQRYVSDRYQGGGNLLGWGEVRRLLSLMHERLHVAQGLLSQALHQVHGGTDRPGNLSAAYGALHLGQLACEQTTDGVQLLGGNGYMKDYGQEKRMRDARQLHGLLGGVAWRRQRLIARTLAHAA